MPQKLRRAFIRLMGSGFVEFCLLGIFNTFTNALFSSLAHKIHLQQNVSAVLGYLLSLTIAFFLNCKIVFLESPTVAKYIKFMLSYIPNFIIYFLVTFITINTMNLPQFWGTVLAVMAGGPITYIIIRLYAFGNAENRKRNEKWQRLK